MKPGQAEQEESATLRRLREQRGGAIVEVGLFRGEETAIIDPAAVVDVCRFLKEDAGCEFVLLSDLCGVHYMDREYEYEVVYHLYSFKFNRRLRLKARLSAPPLISSVTPVWATANWHEREVFDLVGVSFEGHPDLRRILMPEDYDRHPLRRDFQLYE